MLRRLDSGERLLRVDIAVRAAAAQLADGEHRIVVVRCAPDGTVEIHLSGRASLAEPWRGADHRWTMPSSVPVEDLATGARAVGAPCIALTQVGVDEEDWDVLVDVEAAGLLAVDADPDTADDVVRALAVGLASSEFAEVAHLVGVGLDEEAFLGHRHAQVVPTVDEAIELAATLIGTDDDHDPIDVLAARPSHRRRGVGAGGRRRRHGTRLRRDAGGHPVDLLQRRTGHHRWRSDRPGAVDAAARRVDVDARTARNQVAPVGLDRDGLDDLDDLVVSIGEPIDDPHRQTHRLSGTTSRRTGSTTASWCLPTGTDTTVTTSQAPRRCSTPNRATPRSSSTPIHRGR